MKAAMAFSSAVFMALIAVMISSVAGAAFRVELIRRDSPRSPLYNPDATFFDRVKAAARRSSFQAYRLTGRRTSWLAAAGDEPIESRLSPDKNGGEFLMELSLGTPAFKIVAIADTGSDLTWTNCVPCTRCYEQIPPLFDPEDSSTYRNLACNSQSCAALPVGSCGTDSTCDYSYTYGDRSNVIGVLAAETFTFATTVGSKITIPKVVFGCSHQSAGTFSNSTAGIVGLGAGQVSLVTQLGSSIDHKFSYCLLPYGTEASSHISFGTGVSGSKAITTPMIIADTFYYLSLRSITVGGTTVPVSSGSRAAGDGNIIIDSGTTLTILNPSVVEGLVQAVTDAVGLPRVSDPELNIFGVCFDTSQSGGGGGFPEEAFPDTTFNFEGADLKLRPVNMFVQLAEDVVCLAVSAASDVQIFGNIAQQNYHVGYDLRAQQLSFAPADCTKI